LRRERLYLLAGNSPLGLRLPLNSLPWVQPVDDDSEPPVDPFAPRDALPERAKGKRGRVRAVAARDVIKTALALEARDGHLRVFLPPIERLEAAIALIDAIEDAARETGLPVILEGYPPPRDPRIASLAVTPDPGVIEVNVQPASSWRTLIESTMALYADARSVRLATEKFMLDGRHTGTGGGNHVTLGGATSADSPLLRRPDLLKSLIGYWQNHPSLSYLFSGTFIGPTSQAPRVDEARDDRLYELEIAFQELGRLAETGKESPQPWLVDRLLRHLLTDLTGNTHRAEFSIDKLYSPDSATGRLGLLEFRGFEMPPHARMSAVQMLLLRALVARFWREPWQGRLERWGTALHDRLAAAALRRGGHPRRRRRPASRGLPVRAAWFDPFVEFRFPRYGTVTYDGATLELRAAIEPWHVLGEEMSGTGTSRYVDSSVERMQLKATGLTPGRHAVACNGRALPLTPDRRARRVRRRRALSRVEPAVRRCTRRSACRRRSRSTSSTPGRTRARRLHLPRVASGRPQLRDLPGQRERGRGAPVRALLAARPHARADDARARAANPATPATLDLRYRPARVPLSAWRRTCRRRDNRLRPAHAARGGRRRRRGHRRVVRPEHDPAAHRARHRSRRRACTTSSRSATRRSWRATA
jgi:uncharacterized protein (DUF2126 family)